MCFVEARERKNAIKLNTVDYALSLHNEKYSMKLIDL